MDILFDYSFLTVALGTTILAIASSTIGTISVLTKQSLVGDTIAHASYPGVIFAYMIFQSRNPLLLTLGAIFSGYISYYTVHFITKYSKHSKINALALVSASYFGLGIVLKHYLQGFFQNSAQAGLQQYLFGQAAFIQLEDIFLIAFISIVCLLIFLLNFNNYKLFIFDPTFSAVNGVPTKRLTHLLTFMLISLTAVGLKVVGAILMSSFLIAPAIAGLIWSNKYFHTIIIAIMTSITSSLIGTYLSSITEDLSTGPTIIIMMTSLTLISFGVVEYIKPIYYKIWR